MNARIEDDRPTTRPAGWYSRLSPLKRGVLIGVLVALVLGLCAQFWWIPASVSSTGNRLQNTLMDDYGTAAASLHRCKVNSASAANVATAETDALDKVLNDAIGGKFGSATDPGQQGSFQNQFIAAMRPLYPVSLYPDTSKLAETFDHVMAVVTGCQDDFLGDQRTVQLDVKNLRDFINGSWLTRSYGGGDYPTDALEVNLPGVPHLTGKAAFRQMATPITDSSTANAYATGMDNDSLKGPFDNGASPQPSK